MKTWMIAVAGCMVGVSTLNADDANSWIGRHVMPKEGCRVMLGTTVVDERTVTLPMVVSSVENGWLYIGAGYVRPADVVAWEDAAAYYSEVIEQNPNSDRAYNQRAAVLFKQGEFQNAVADYSTSIRLDPRDATAYANRALALSNLGRYDEAVADYQTVIRLDPRGAWGYNGLAWLRATCPAQDVRDGRQAVELAAQACKLGRNNPYCLGSLAAAHAELGQFAEAVAYQQQAIDGYHGPDKDSFEEALDFYDSKRPFRDGGRAPATSTAAHTSAKR